MTHTFATLEISAAAYDEIAANLKDAGYGDAIVVGRIDMQGIGLVKIDTIRDAVTRGDMDAAMEMLGEPGNAKRYKFAGPYDAGMMRSTDGAQSCFVDSCEWVKAAEVDALAAQLRELREENERLTGCLRAANSQTEEFERKYYLESHKAEDLNQSLATARETQRELIDMLATHCPGCGFANRLNGRIVHAPLCLYGPPIRALKPTTEA